MNVNKAALVALVLCGGFTVLSMVYWNWEVVLVPYLWSVKPFQLIMPYGVVLGGLFAVLVYWLLKKRER